MPDVVVPSIDDMDDETAYKHLNARHSKDLGLKEPLPFSRNYSKSLVDSHRAYHDRVHKLAKPRQYDHEHLED